MVRFREFRVSLVVRRRACDLAETFGRVLVGLLDSKQQWKGGRGRACGHQPEIKFAIGGHALI